MRIKMKNNMYVQLICTVGYSSQYTLISTTSTIQLYAILQRVCLQLYCTLWALGQRVCHLVREYNNSLYVYIIECVSR